MAKINTKSLTDTPIYKLTNGIYRWFTVSLLWLLCSLPLVTIGAATAAALGEFSDPENNDAHPLVREFFKRFARCFAQGTAVWLGFLVLLMLLVVDVTFYQQFTGSTHWAFPVVALVLGNLLLGYARFAFFCIAATEKTKLTELLKRAGRTLLMCLPMWAIMVGMDLVVVTTLIRVPYLLIGILVLPGVYANVHCMLIQKFLKRYETEDEE